MLSPSLRPGDIPEGRGDGQPLGPQADRGAADHLSGRGLGLVPAALRPGPRAPLDAPIEQAFSKIKQAIRHAAARTAEALERAAVTVMRSMTPSDIHGEMFAAGYPAHGVSND